ncbi:GNAT family N-acetyltransferase [Corynebacterium lizhenjunii]|uniref:GNAT family N-acetyltransferase n=1 Tax=Corynebacterium lizhenjunii TaxID=2709394 RepID=A0A7T0KFE9_9CORY|nr:GNAT family N-acetyltransferase [Corynebacterium lizhenjunii]QPK79612.1 GNAT family N-acetyltransferase [Corynebacterium lizhenjunii]
MRLRELTPADAARCAELEKVLFAGETPWSEEIFRADFARPHTFYFGVEDAPAVAAAAAATETAAAETVAANENAPTADSVLVGYAGLAMLGPVADPEWEILTIGVDPAAQRRGVARAMMDNICHIADRTDSPVFLEVRVGNDPALRLYEAYGFIYTGIRRNYYQPSGADAHTMVRPRSSERQ